MSEDFASWFEKKGKHHEERDEIAIAGKKAVDRALKASWWEWDYGSSLFFWRWPEDYQDIACKGVPPMFLSPPPSCKETQPKINDEKLRLMIREKLEKVLKKKYIEITDIQMVESIMYMFDVVKGDDIRMVYDGSKSGLNDLLWAPWFALPTIDTMTRWTLAGTWLADNDYGEMFLNFPMHPDLQKYCGIDLT